MTLLDYFRFLHNNLMEFSPFIVDNVSIINDKNVGGESVDFKFFLKVLLLKCGESLAYGIF